MGWIQGALLSLYHFIGEFRCRRLQDWISTNNWLKLNNEKSETLTDLSVKSYRIIKKDRYLNKNERNKKEVKEK